MIKPNFDLKDPIIKYAINTFQTEVINALNAPQTVEKAVVPIYAILKRKGHQAPSQKPQQIGTGVLVNIVDQYFIFTAAHVVKEFMGYVLLTSTGNGTPLQELKGESFCNDIYDSAVFHVQEDISDSLKNLAITLDDFDPNEVSNIGNPIFTMVGFRTKKSNTAGNETKSKRDCFPTLELDETTYTTLKKDRQTTIILSYEDQVLVDNKWTTSPVPRGMSGGAIIKATGTGVLSKENKTTNVKQLLTAIIIEHYRDKNKQIGHVIGTRVVVFLSLIHQYLPEIFNELISKEA